MRIIGNCSLCNGPVTTRHAAVDGQAASIAECNQCGTSKANTYGPVIEMLKTPKLPPVDEAPSTPDGDGAAIKRMIKHVNLSKKLNEIIVEAQRQTIAEYQDKLEDSEKHRDGLKAIIKKDTEEIAALKLECQAKDRRIMDLEAVLRNK